MTRGWTCWRIRPLTRSNCPDESQNFLRVEMAGESSVALTSDRERILLSAALEVPKCTVGKLYFRGAAGDRARALPRPLSRWTAPGSVPADSVQFPRSRLGVNDDGGRTVD